MLEKMKKFARVGTLVAATIIGAPPTESHVESSLDLEQQTSEQKLEDLEIKRVKNEKFLNDELKSRGLSSVKLTARAEVTRCGGNVSVDVYTEKGEHLFGKNCSKNVFDNKYIFLEEIVTETVELLKAIDLGEEPDYELIERKINFDKAEALLNLSHVSDGAKSFFVKNGLKLKSLIFDAGPGGEVVFDKSDEKNKIYLQVVCYYKNIEIKSVNIDYDASRDVLVVKTSFENKNEEIKKFKAKYSDSGNLKDLTLIK